MGTWPTNWGDGTFVGDGGTSSGGSGGIVLPIQPDSGPPTEGSVGGPGTPVISSFTASSGSISSGGSTTLSFTETGATSMTINDGSGEVLIPDGTTSITVSPTSTTTYTLKATNDVGYSFATITILVHGANAENVRSHQIRRQDRQGDSLKIQMGAGTPVLNYPALYDGDQNVVAQQPRGNTTVLQKADQTGGFNENDLLAFDYAGNAKDSQISLSDLITTSGAGGSATGLSLKDWYGQVPRGVVNGSNTVFQVDYTLKSPYAVLMLNGRVLLPDVQGDPANPLGTMITPNGQFDVTQWTLTTGSAPASGSDFYIWYFRDLPLPTVQSWDLTITARFHQNVVSSSAASFSKYNTTSFAFGQIPISWAASDAPVTQTISLTGSTQEGFTFDADTTAADLSAFTLLAFQQIYESNESMTTADQLAWLDIYDLSLKASYEDGSVAIYRPSQFVVDDAQGFESAVDDPQNATDNDSATYARLHQYPASGLFWDLTSSNSFGLTDWVLYSTTVQFHPVLSPVGNSLQQVNALSGSYTSPANLTGQTFVATGSSPSTFTLPSVLAAPAAPTLSQSAGGSLAAATDYVKITYTSASGETLPSSEANLAVSANNLLGVASPTAVSGATGWNVYVGTATGVETKQNNIPIPIGTAWTEPTIGLTTTTAKPPTTDTASPASGYSVTLANTGTSTISITPPSGTTLNGSTSPIPLTAGQTGTVFFNPSTGNFTLITSGTGTSSGTSTPIVDSAGDPLVDSSGDWIFV